MFPYTLKTSSRARNLRLSVHPGGSLTATAPAGMPLSVIERFIATKSEWIARAVKRMSRLDPKEIWRARGTKREYLAYRDAARALVMRRLPELNASYGFSYKRITIRNPTSRWGSCSKQGNLNFNYRIALLPLELADYIIVHELCHLKEFNHSKAFWQLVANKVPNHKELRKRLRA